MDTELSGGQVVAEALRREGVDTVFGLIGSATMELFDALYQDEGVRFVGVRDERTGVHMADGYARVSGRPGIMVAGQNGPGVTNLVTGVAQALRAYSPVITLGGAIAREHMYRDGFQELDQQSLFAPITKATYSVSTTGQLPFVMQNAFRVALTPPQGPIHVNLPRDVLAARVQASAIPAMWAHRPAHAPAGDEAAVRRAAGLLSRAERPCIVAGGGIKRGGRNEEVIALAETLHSPVAASAGHGDAIPTTHPLAAGQVGPRGNAVATRLLKEADVILALGTRLGFNSTFFSYDNLNPDAAIIHVDIDTQTVGRHFPVAIGIVGDAPTVAKQLLGELSSHHVQRAALEWTDAFKSERHALLAERETHSADKSTPLQPARVFAALRRTLPTDAIVTLDAGTLCLQATDMLDYREPPALLTPLDFGLVGFSFAAGLGAKLAAPARPVISLMGDGGFGMTLAELSTAVMESIDTTIVVLNNHCWGAEKAYQRDFFGQRYIGADLHNPPFDEVAQLYGARGFAVRDPDALEPTLSKAFAEPGPTVVDVQVSPDALYSFRRDSFKHRATS